MKPVEHKQVWTKVNASVDEEIAEIVSLLSEIPGLQTIQSCEGEPGGRPAYVYFYYGDWSQIGRLAFDGLAPRLDRAGDDVTISVEMFNGSAPMGRLRFEREATTAVASALRAFNQERP
jgi:hypothetical protein|tara:strand:- start:635 stop:991 length:357 start_codon:yes stop_codon:yes gene_type:complete